MKWTIIHVAEKIRTINYVKIIEIYNYLDFLLFACDLKSTSVYILDSEMVFDLNKNGAN